MVAGKNHHIGQIVINKIMRKDVIYTHHSLTPSAVVFIETGAESIVQREVHD